MLHRQTISIAITNYTLKSIDEEHLWLLLILYVRHSSVQQRLIKHEVNGHRHKYQTVDAQICIQNIGSTREILLFLHY